MIYLFEDRYYAGGECSKHLFSVMLCCLYIYCIWLTTSVMTCLSLYKHNSLQYILETAWPIFGFCQYIGIGQNGWFYRPQ